MAFESMYLEEDIHIDRIYTIHYFEYKSDFHFAGERHNFSMSLTLAKSRNRKYL